MLGDVVGLDGHLGLVVLFPSTFRLEWVKSPALFQPIFLGVLSLDVPSALLPCQVFLVQLWRHGVSLPGHHIRCSIRGYKSFGGLLVLCCLAVLMIAEINWQ